MRRLTAEEEKKRERSFEQLHCGWALLQDQKFDEALPLLEQAFQLHRTPAMLNNVAMAKLGMEDYVGAQEAFTYSLENNPNKNEFGYIHIGVCEWCQGNPHIAVETWKSGIGCQYSDAAGGMSIPLLLIFAGTVLHDNSLPLLAEQEILTRMRRFGQNWPAPLARFLIGKITFSELMEIIGTDTLALQDHWYPLAKFYQSVAFLCDGDKKCYIAGLETFTSTLRHRVCPEWFLARYELRKLNNART
jgi:tetratricopeptide (TPR) repeat protein